MSSQLHFVSFDDLFSMVRGCCYEVTALGVKHRGRFRGLSGNANCTRQGGVYVLIEPFVQAENDQINVSGLWSRNITNITQVSDRSG